MNDLTGQTLGQYRIVEPIGRGGMASVYKAYQPSLDRYVAIKVLPPYYAHEPGFAMRFTREAKAVAGLDHPHILPIYDFGQEGDVSYIVMKYVAAGTLKDILDGPVPVAQAAELIGQIAAALDHAHERGVIHRDIKPSNVLMDRGRWALLMDFGLAKMVAGSVQLTASGVGVGTPAYMAPEQGQGTAVDRRADVYSLGVVLYEMLTGRVPFDAETPLAVVLKHITDPLPMPCAVNPAIPEAVERVILKALSKQPDGRYATAGEMAAALRRALVEAETAPEVAIPLAEAVPLPEEPVVPVAVEAPARRKLPRWAFAAGAVAVVALVVGVLLATGVFSGKEPGPGPTPTSIPAQAYVTEGSLGAVLFEDDFEGRPSSRWQFFPEEWQTENVDGRTVLHNAPTMEYVGGAELRETSWSDYAVQFDFRFLKPDSHGEYYLFVRTRYGENCPPTVASTNSYVLLISPDYLELRQETCDLPGEQPMLAQSDRDLALDEWHTVQLIAVGNRIRVLVDGQEQIDYTDQDTPHLGSDIVVETQNNVEFLLDNFRVYEIIPGSGAVATPTVLSLPAQPGAGKIVETCKGVTPPQLCVQDVETGRITQLTDNLEFKEISNWPAWSPDGQQIVFDAGSSEGHNLYIINADGSDLGQVTSGAHFDGWPVWSPDGEWIAFNRGCGLWLIRPDGSDMQMFLEGSRSFCVRWIAWSPDSQQIAFSNSGDVVPAPFEMWVINRDGTDARVVYSFDERSPGGGGGVAWSADGRQIASEYAEGEKMKNFLVSADGSGEPQMIDEMPLSWLPTFWPQWSDSERYGVAAAPTPTALPAPAQPKEGKIVRECEGVTPPELCVQDMETGRITKITDGLGFEIVHEPVWSPDGQQIAFRAGSASYDDHQLYIINADGSDLRQITHGDVGITDPDWSPDGEWIAFSDSGHLVLIRPDGSEERQILEKTYNHGASVPRWSPDGQQIAFKNSSAPTTEPEMWVVGRDGSDPHLVYAFDGPQEGYDPVWSTDGRIAIGYDEDGREMCLLASADGGGEAERMDGGCPGSWFPRFWPRWSEGKEIAAPVALEPISPGSPPPDTRDVRPCDWDGLGPGLCIFGAESTTPAKILQDVELEFTGPASWSPDGQRIAFTAQEPGADLAPIYVVNVDGTGLHKLTSQENTLAPAWSPDGEWLAFHSSCDLALMRPDGSEMAIVWQHDDRCTMTPQWSPDSEWIVFSLIPKGEWAFPMTREVWVISRDGEVITPVASITHESRECLQETVAFSPEIGDIAYFDANCRPMIVNADGSGQPVPLTDFPYWWTSTVYPQWGEGEPEPTRKSMPTVAPSGRAIHVDANAPATGSNGSQAAPFNAIQTAIAVAGPGDTIKVATGTYDEHPIIDGKTLILQGGYDPDTWEVTGQPADTVIDGGGRDRVILIVNGSRVVIEGFTVMNGNGLCRNFGGGGGIVVLGSTTEATIQRSIIRDNIATPPCGGGGIEMGDGATVAVINSLITGNSASDSSGIGVWTNSNLLVMNTTITGNYPDGVGTDDRDRERAYSLLINTIVWNNGERDIYGNTKVVNSLISQDPLFVDPDNGDYHLQPASPAVDAGTPDGAPETDIDGDPRPMGDGVDIGADEMTGEVTTASPADQARAFAEPILAAIAGREPTWSDDFSDPGSGWPVGSTADGDEWDYKDGVFSIVVAPGHHDAGFPSGHASSFSDFVLEVDVRFISGEWGHWYVSFRDSRGTAEQPIDASYSVRFYPDGGLGVSKNVHDVNTELIETAVYAPIFEEGDGTNRLTIVARGPQIAVYMNGEPLWFVYDESSGRGIVLLGGGNESDDSMLQVQFDNLKVWDISAPSSPSAVPTPNPAPQLRDSKIESNIPYMPGEPPLRYRLFVDTWVDDPQGAGDIADVTLTYPDGSVHSLITEGEPHQPDAENNFDVGLWLDNPLTGEFVFTATDQEGHFTQETVVVDEWLPIPDYVSPEPSAVYHSGDALALDFNFPFDPSTRVAQYWVYIQKGHDPGLRLEQIWQRTVSSPPVEYDGPPLPAGEYHWGVHVLSVKGNSFHLLVPFKVE